MFCYPQINSLKVLQFQQIFLDLQSLGADGSLTGYAEGLEIKEYLLELEQF